MYSVRSCLKFYRQQYTYTQCLTNNIQFFISQIKLEKKKVFRVFKTGFIPRNKTVFLYIIFFVCLVVLRNSTGGETGQGRKKVAGCEFHFYCNKFCISNVKIVEEGVLV